MKILGNLDRSISNVSLSYLALGVVSPTADERKLRKIYLSGKSFKQILRFFHALLLLFSARFYHFHMRVCVCVRACV